MKKTKLLLVQLSTTFVIFLVVIIFNSLNNKAIAWKDNFMATCKNISLSDNNKMRHVRLFADCRTFNKEYTRTSVNLDESIWNEDGRLTWDVFKGYGNFSRSCYNIRLNRNAVLYATCRKVNGRWKETVLPLNKIYHNHDGVLGIDSIWNGMPGRLRGQY
ncbi:MULTISPECIES: CVNH domain-containing protein [Nostoc]|uniref:Cyanovirin-N domain-containing protein n=1 Tax=Nostoc paludosum FACHB-159 TaxID=2692908 RepID=A0ABR8KIQ5_9NOSO|nr:MULTISPECIES: CVNH domain-containing protein [Nostoc]MBD2682313.1 hypothetical protein [Nostoc sp. FACHB-857]MBD2738646.1 hypothetical protein [Nostoc paludosum FACHB-159]